MPKEPIVIKNWADFETKLGAFYAEVEKKRSATRSVVDEPIFRGQSDSRWKLLTVLSLAEPCPTPASQINSDKWIQKMFLYTGYGSIRRRIWYDFLGEKPHSCESKR